jgi:phage/plasmid-associated DNA primase
MAADSVSLYSSCLYLFLFLFQSKEIKQRIDVITKELEDKTEGKEAENNESESDESVSEVKKSEQDKTEKVEDPKKLKYDYKKYTKIINQLQTNHFKKTIIDECVQFANDLRLKVNLDSNTNLFAFKNGILDIKTCTFRKGCPEDYISLCSFVEYKPGICTDEVQERLINKIFPNEDIRKYKLARTATYFYGGDGKVLFNLGSGRNGKSLFHNDYLRQVFGTYYHILSANTFKKDYDPDQPHSSLSRIDN